ncbi:3-alpha--hydroxysteroid dehydrogenase [Whalleya microplaca]|nr:3-alpha--hydroxysteroid dehydrogenase [Whalleya microplaca]
MDKRACAYSSHRFSSFVQQELDLSGFNMANPLPLKDRVILITGAAQGIGEATARYLAARGATLSLSDISGEKLQAAGQRIAELFPESQVMTTLVDICNPKSVEEWVARAKAEFGRIDGCVNSAGIVGKDPSPITELDFDQWNSTINVNLTGMFNCLKYELRAIGDGGSIVNIGSIAGQHGLNFYPAYTASKHGVIGLSKTAATESANRGIRVNVVCPAFTDTPMCAQVYGQSDESIRVENLPQLFHRLVEPEEVAGLISYLLSDESRFITKSVYPISGGFGV